MKIRPGAGDARKRTQLFWFTIKIKASACCFLRNCKNVIVILASIFSPGEKSSETSFLVPAYDKILNGSEHMLV